MKPSDLRPEDYVRNYSSAGDAQLLLHIVDERPPKGLRPWARNARHRLRTLLTGYDANDREAERFWSAMQREWGDTSVDTVQRFLERRFAADHLRTFEYAFLAECLARPDIPKAKILDMGGGNSYSTIVPMLLRLSGVQILSLDPVNRPNVSKYGVRYLQGDCMHSGLGDASVDVVTIISTLEHVGLGRWGDPLAADGDVQAMQEARRVLVPGGHVVLTIPYGYPTVVYNLHRIYDAGRLERLLDGLEVAVARYSLNGHLCSQQDAEGKRATIHIPGYYEEIPDEERHPDAQAGALLLLKKR